MKIVVLRTCLFASILFFHALSISEIYEEPNLQGIKIGYFCVFFLYIISGNLLSTLFLSSSLESLLRNRIKRLFLPLLINLSIIAFIFDPIIVLFGDCARKWSFASSVKLFYFLIFRIFRNDESFFICSKLNIQDWNGSLWTMRYTLLCYLVFLIFRLRLPIFNRYAHLILLLLVSITLQSIMSLNFNQINFYRQLVLQITLSFFMGISSKILQCNEFWFFCFIVFVMPLFLKNYSLFGINVIIIALSIYSRTFLSKLDSRPKVDISYEFYLYSFPVTNLVFIFGRNHDSFIMFTSISLLCTFIISYGLTYFTRKIFDT